MSNIVGSGFITGARAKIKIGGTTMAFAADVSYNVTIATVPIETMGKYEVHTNEPVSYTVDGSFSVVRYTAADAKASNITDENSSGHTQGTAAAGNLSSEVVYSTGTAPGDQLDPGNILSSQTFDLEIQEKFPGGGTADQSVFTIQSCRVTRRGASLNKRGILVDNYSYVGVLAGDTDVAANNVKPSSMDT